MKKQVLLVLVMAAVATTWGQSYHPLVETGKVWSTIHNYYPGMQPYSDFIRFSGDTAINGLTYKKVWRSTDANQSVWTSDGFIREDDGHHVYYLTWAGGAPNNMLYDFSAQAGDTVYLFADPMGAFLKVDSVGTATLLNGEARRQLYLSCYFAGSGQMGHDTWIEGTGSLFGMLQSGMCLLVGDTPQLLCFTENDTLKYFNPGFSTCYVVTGTNEKGAMPDAVSVFPNPAEDHLTVSVKEQSLLPLKITFTDPAGRRVLERLLNSENMEISFSGMSAPPVLFYSVSGRNGGVSSGKIIMMNRK